MFSTRVWGSGIGNLVGIKTGCLDLGKEEVVLWRAQLFPPGGEERLQLGVDVRRDHQRGPLSIRFACQHIRSGDIHHLLAVPLFRRLFKARDSDVAQCWGRRGVGVTDQQL